LGVTPIGGEPDDVEAGLIDRLSSGNFGKPSGGSVRAASKTDRSLSWAMYAASTANPFPGDLYLEFLPSEFLQPGSRTPDRSTVHLASVRAER
jgi:hypothetical protein